MKKRIFLFISVLLITLTTLALSACAQKLTQNTRLSELRDNIFVGESDSYKVSAATGMRETPFKIDGKSQKEKANFTVFTVTPDTLLPATDYFFEVTVGGKKHEGKLVRHPFNQTLSVEISAAVTEEFLEILITCGNTETVRLNSVKTENYISADKAYEIAWDKLKKTVDEKAKTKDYEVFVRLIENPVNSSGGYHWYVAFVFENDDTYAVLIEPVSMEIVAIKE